jgi:hypothetical protein
MEQNFGVSLPSCYETMCSFVLSWLGGYSLLPEGGIIEKTGVGEGEQESREGLLFR